MIRIRTIMIVAAAVLAPYVTNVRASGQSRDFIFVIQQNTNAYGGLTAAEGDTSIQFGGDRKYAGFWKGSGDMPFNVALFGKDRMVVALAEIRGTVRWDSVGHLTAGSDAFVTLEAKEKDGTVVSSSVIASQIKKEQLILTTADKTVYVLSNFDMNFAASAERSPSGQAPGPQTPSSPASAQTPLIPNAAPQYQKYVTAEGITIPEGAEGMPDANLGYESFPGRALRFSLSSKAVIALLDISGVVQYTSEGKLARGTEKMKPTIISTSKHPEMWHKITAFAIDENGFLIVADDAGSAYRIAFGQGFTGVIEEVVVTR